MAESMQSAHDLHQLMHEKGCLTKSIEEWKCSRTSAAWRARLLTALAADQQNKPVVARAILECHGLTSPYDAVRAFPAARERRHRLNKGLADILGPRLR